METLQYAGLLVLGFALLIKGADIFVDSSVNIARRFHIPNVVIGLTLVAMGTSLPEAVVSVTAALNGANDMAVSNILGSNIFNILIITGLCAQFKTIPVDMKEIAGDFGVSVAAAALLLVLSLIGGETIPRAGAFILLAVFVAYLMALLRQSLRHKAPPTANHAPRIPLPKNIALTVLGALLIMAGGNLAVTNAVEIARLLGITERIIGLTVLAFGTSSPELVTSVIAFRKGQTDMALGNVIGSNIFNILMALGVSGAIAPLAVGGGTLFDMGALLFGSLVFYAVARSNFRIVRAEGLLLIGVYAGYMTLVMRG